MPFALTREDITQMRVDAIVNAANPELRMGGGVCGAISRAAGPEQMEAACRPLAPIRVGEAVITPGFRLPARYVIHTAGPVYEGGKKGEEALLRSCYENSLRLAADNGCESVAFPLISSGIYGYPKAEALQVATQTILHMLESLDLHVFLTLPDRKAFSDSSLLREVERHLEVRRAQEGLSDKVKGLFSKRRPELEVFQDMAPTELRPGAPAYDPKAADRAPFTKGPYWSLSDDAVSFREAAETAHEDRVLFENAKKLTDAAPRRAAPVRDRPAASLPSSLEAMVGNLDEPFSVTLFRLIDARGRSDAEVYRRANLDRKLFSKIRSIPGYMPGKRTVIALAMALELNLPETEDLLKRAGFALSTSQKFDVVIRYFIGKKVFDLFRVNEVLFSLDLPLLGGERN